MSQNPYPTGSIPNRHAAHRRSTNSLPGRRSMKRSNRNRSSARSSASARRKRRRQPNDNQSIYHSQNQLIHNQYDISSLDSFAPNSNPIYSGSLHSVGSRFSLYTINPHSTLERICVDTTNNRRRQRSPIYMNGTMNSSETVM